VFQPLGETVVAENVAALGQTGLDTRVSRETDSAFRLRGCRANCFGQGHDFILGFLDFDLDASVKIRYINGVGKPITGIGKPFAKLRHMSNIVIGSVHNWARSHFFLFCFLSCGDCKNIKNCKNFNFFFGDFRVKKGLNYSK
jgi:hypothetical protein